MDYTTLKDEPGREGWWAITEPTMFCKGDAEGVYQWKDPDGVFRDKYKYTRIVQVKTGDGISLALAASTYLDEYKKENNFEKEETFQELSIKLNFGPSAITLTAKSSSASSMRIYSYLARRFKLSPTPIPP